MGTNSNPTSVASTRVGDNATVIVLGIHYDHSIVCNRKCNMLDQDDEGIIVCALDRVKNIVNFQTHSLVIDYQCILDKDSDENWRVYESDFKVIDEEGFIHEGHVICEDIIYPIKSVENGHTLFKGTRGNIVIPSRRQAYPVQTGRERRLGTTDMFSIRVTRETYLIELTD